MTQFYLPQLSLDTCETEITGSEFRHIVKSLRFKEGDVIRLFNGKGLVAQAQINRIFKDKVEVKILQKEFLSQAKQKLVLCQGVIKLDKFELVLEKTTELGVDIIIPLLLERSVVEKEKLEKKYNRFQQIIIEAAKQSHKVYIPEIKLPAKLEELQDDEEDNTVNIVLYKNAKDNFSKIVGKIKKSEIVKIYVGPEGDFTEKELNFLSKKKNVYFITLGDRILRSETASILVTGMVDQIRQGLI